LNIVMQKVITFIKKTYFNIMIHNFKYKYVIHLFVIIAEVYKKCNLTILNINNNK